MQSKEVDLNWPDESIKLPPLAHADNDEEAEARRQKRELLDKWQSEGLFNPDSTWGSQLDAHKITMVRVCVIHVFYVLCETFNCFMKRLTDRSTDRLTDRLTDL